MTFLELCRAVGLKSGLISSQNQMATTVDQVGRQLKIVVAVQDAWNTIQTGRTDWAWMRATYSHDVGGMVTSYAPVDLGIAARFRSFMPDIRAEGFQPHTIYDPLIGVSDETELCQITPLQWRTKYARGAQISDRPYEYALEAGKILIGPAPNKTYVLSGLYMNGAQILAADADVPELPVDFHDVIKWRAIMDMHGQDAAFADRSVAQAEYSRLYRLLANEQTAPVVIGGALA